MKKLRNRSRLKEQNSSEGANNEIVLCSLTDAEFKKEIVTILKELGGDMNSRLLKKGTRKYKEEPRKIRKFIYRGIQGEVKANILDEYGRKNSQQNFSHPNPTTYKKDHTPQPSEIHPKFTRMVEPMQINQCHA